MTTERDTNLKHDERVDEKLKNESTGAIPVEKDEMEAKGHGDELEESVDQVVEKGRRPEEIRAEGR
jgi:hypothetical protein